MDKGCIVVLLTSRNYLMQSRSRFESLHRYVLEPHKCKMKAFKEHMHDCGCKHLSWKGMYQYCKHGDQLLKPPTTQHNHAGTKSPLKRKHNFVEKSSETTWQAIEDPHILKELPFDLNSPRVPPKDAASLVVLH